MTANRFVSNLAAALLAGEWSVAGLRTSVYRATGKRFGWTPRFAKRVHTAHATPPTFNELLAFLGRDPGFVRALAALATARYPADRFPVWHIFAPPEPPPRPRPDWASGLPVLPNEPALAEWLGVPVGHLLWLADPAGRNAISKGVRSYRVRWVPKPKGRARLLEIPVPPLKRVQRKLLADLLNHVPPHPAVHGFRPGRSIVTNATPHCGHAIVIRFDLTDFFASVPVGRVLALFLALGYRESVARLLSGLCTTRLASNDWNERPNPLNDGSEHATRARLTSRHLPQGAPTSPALANLVALRLDRRLAGLAAACGATYTRYADDLTFSGGELLRRNAARFVRRVTLIAAEEGFALNRGKTRVMGGGGRQTVTGVVVNQRPNVPRAEFDRLKAILTNCVRHGPADQNRSGHPDFRSHLAGRVAYVAGVNPVRGRKLWALFDRITWPGAHTYPAS
ncbi:Reverse transcriptase (RNA-dependent DNA polymerase) [Gemmata obscuriglobus]|uniref:RNA-directed DNA polymerase n=1 Tax=Gemmata obscuriglobus TaxID=114 RepID=A0A2Z3H3S5_9BACT|nr:reverse transcriptase family protein [Gemmata obscuriglobus]AWM37745.1 RNA-directed DNA polymerase [Gemmata obscuriglobus]QEG29443.1 Reverse transcriptase (RNA-dependent DNA polymerase) [Gemmata obscuriglobus]VTS08560.1 reverse transcriptase : Reverse transcriptase OS=Burkholderia dolosa PC543 GN=BDSB_26335 PE=4 SV=1: RVT_1 [Gemmata obscuriglobus UQM 2246]